VTKIAESSLSIWHFRSISKTKISVLKFPCEKKK
jgi:hypothetical protein